MRQDPFDRVFTQSKITCRILRHEYSWMENSRPYRDVEQKSQGIDADTRRETGDRAKSFKRERTK